MTIAPRLLLFMCLTGFFTLISFNPPVYADNHTSEINESAVITWAHNSADEPLAAYSGSTSDFFRQDYMTLGGNLHFQNVRTSNNVTFRTYNPDAQTGSGSDNAISFHIRTVSGLSFTPTIVSFKAQRYGTDSGLLDVIWKSTDGTETTIAEGLKPARDNSGTYTNKSYNLASLSIPASSEDCSLTFILYDLGNTKEAGLADIVLEGTVSGTVIDVETYQLTTAVSPAASGSVSTSPVGNEFDEGTEMTLTAENNFGYEFSHWEDASNQTISTANPFTLTITADAEITAVFNEINTWSLDVNLDGGAKDYMLSFRPEGTWVEGKRRYEEGTYVSVSAADNAILTFTNWNTGETSSNLTVKMDRNRALTAYYSATDYIVGWDFYVSGNSNRVADFYSNSSNASSTLILRNAAGNTASWLDKSTEAAGGYEEAEGAAVNWNPLLSRYYYQISLNATGFKDIKVSASMMYNYNAYSVQKCEYSLDGTTFKSLGTYQITTPKIKWPKSFNLPSEANNAEMIYIRWIPDYSSSIVGSSTTKDGTVISDIYITGTREIVDNGVDPELVSSIPEDGFTGASATGKVVLTFNEKIKIAPGTTATIGSKTLTPVVTGKIVTFNYTGLDFNTAYTFSLNGGVISDLTDHVISGPISITFTTLNNPTVAKKAYDFIVGKDGDFKDAVLAAAQASSSGKRFYIFFPNGSYNIGALTGDANEMTTLSLSNISFIGESADGVILYNKPTHESINSTATLYFTSACQNNYMQDITLKNRYDYNNTTGRAVALWDKGTKSIYKNVKLLSYQDTYYTGHGRSYLEGCEIHGVVDFICGGGDIFFNECLIYLEERSGNVITAPATAEDWGYVFSDCTIDGHSVNNGKFRLGRPWSNAPKCVFINTKMNVVPTATAWGDPMNVVPDVFAEYNSMASDGSAIDLSNRRTTYTKDGNTVQLNPVLSTGEAAQYTIENVLGGGDLWQPKLHTEQAPIPDIEIGQHTLSWKNSDYVLGWAILKNGSFETFVTENNYTIPDDTPNSTLYSVRSANAMGGLGAASNEVTYFNQPLAFPGAEGGGMFTTGGRSGKVYFVNSLADTYTGNSVTHEGTLRWCLGQSGPKTILFKVGGIIELQKDMNVNDNTTIAGQTAPGDGICLKNYSLKINGDNIIVRYIRSRMGDEAANESDAIWGRNQSDIMIDHCSLSWSTDECGSFYDNTNFTLQWCILSESLRASVHGKGSHGYGGIWGGKTATFHHNILAHHDSRNPRMNGSRYSGRADLELVDFRNNVIYNWGGNSGYAGMGGRYNFINNYYKAGPSSSNKTRIFEPYGDDGKYTQAKGVWGTFYVSGNFVTASELVTKYNYGGIHPNEGNCDLPAGGLASILSDVEFAVPGVTTQSAEEAYELVLENAGASLRQDPTDARVINEIRNGLAPDRASNGTTKLGLIDTQTDVGGWDTYSFIPEEVPTDSDRDGMPDDWETAKDLNPNDATDRNIINDKGYTNLEVYLNELVSPTYTPTEEAFAAISSDLVVYQNKDRNSLTIQFVPVKNQFAYVSVYDVQGRCVLQKSIQPNENELKKTQISTHSLQGGLHLVQVITGNTRQTQKVILLK